MPRTPAAIEIKSRANLSTRRIEYAVIANGQPLAEWSYDIQTATAFVMEQVRIIDQLEKQTILMPEAVGNRLV
jgi:hypothetical protein